MAVPDGRSDLGAAMPLDEIRVVLRERAEEAGGVLDEAGEQHHAEAEVGGGDRRGIVADQ